MATNDSLETQASQRINPFLRGLSMLTGGIAGEFTGTNEQIRRQNAINQALLQDEFAKRDEERAMRRQLMANALKEGVELDPNATLDQMMADYRKKQVQGEIMRSQGRIFGLGQSVGPSPYEANPQYQAAVLGGQRELAEKRAEATALEDINRSKIAEKIRGFGATPTPGASAGELEGQLESVRMEAQSKIPLQQRGEQAKAELKTLQGLNAFPSPVNIDSLTPQQAISQAEIYGRKYQQENYFGAFERKSQAENKAIDEFNTLLSNPNRDQEALKKAYLNLPKDARLEEYRIAAGVKRPATAKETESLDKYISSIDKSSSLAKSISDLVGTGDIANVSKSDFNGYRSWFRSLENKYGAEDPRLRSINNVIQEFQSLIADQRKNFFGASLTDNEFEVAKSLFGDPNQASFLPRVIQLVDSIMSKDEIQRKFDRRGIFVDDATRSDVQNARQNWLKTREQFNFGNLSTPRKAADSRIKNLQDEAARLRQVLGMTNAPATPR